MQILINEILDISKRFLNIARVFTNKCVGYLLYYSPWRGEDDEKKQTAFQHCHDEPEINKQEKLNVCMHS